MDILTNLGFDAKLFFLGNLCKRNHEFNETGKTLRYVRKPFSCKICKAESAKNSNSKPENKDRANKWQNERYHKRKNTPEFQEYIKEYLDKTREERNERKRKIYENNKEKIKEQLKKSRARNPETRNLPKIRYRHRKRNVHIRYSAKQLRQRIADFNYCCAYCNKYLKDAPKFEMQLDHFIPISKGGIDCLNNLILSCKSCNASKYNNAPHKWYERQVFYSKERWDYILIVLNMPPHIYEMAMISMQAKSRIPKQI